jgi:hypothetical protein
VDICSLLWRVMVHEALEYQTPSQLYVCSARSYPNHIPEFEYAREFLVRAINHSGDMSWHQGRVFISRILADDRVDCCKSPTNDTGCFIGRLCLGVR